MTIDMTSPYPNLVPAYAHCQVNLLNEGIARRVRLDVYDMLGRLRMTVVDQDIEAGSTSIQFHPSGSGLAAGMYRLVLHDGERAVSRPLLLLK